MINSEMIQITGLFNNIKFKINEALGPAVTLEIRMRLIGQFSNSIRDKLKELYKKDKRKYGSSNYWDCKLVALEEAIIEVFADRFKELEYENFQKFRQWRNKFLHGDFVTDLIKFIGINAAGIKISQNGRNILKPSNIQEAIISVDQNQSLNEFGKLANGINDFLDQKIIYQLDPKENFCKPFCNDELCPC